MKSWLTTEIKISHNLLRFINSTGLDLRRGICDHTLFSRVDGGRDLENNLSADYQLTIISIPN